MATTTEASSGMGNAAYEMIEKPDPAAPEADQHDRHSVWWSEPEDKDLENPLNWPNGRKWGVIGVLSLLTFLTYVEPLNPPQLPETTAKSDFNLGPLPQLCWRPECLS